MPTLTLAQRQARAKAIIAEANRSGHGVLEAIRTVNQTMIAEVAQPRAAGAPKPKAIRKAERRAAREVVIAKAVRESLAQTAATRAASPPAKPALPTAKQLAELDSDDLARAAVISVEGAHSPFWARESAPPPPAAVAESASPAAAPKSDKALHELDADELDAALTVALDTHAAAAGYASPSWAR
jgi:hypothetical protein